MAFDEIDELGRSLLQRQRTTRKRTQKRIDKDQRNAMWLNVAGVGVGLANNYLKDRATNFINNNEEIQGQRLLYQKALNNKDRIIEEYGLAQQHAEGVEGWLAEEKFSPLIQANIERTFNTKGSNKKDISNMVLTRARAAAKEHKDDYEKSYEEALKMGTMDDFDSYIRSRDGRAENVGGFLFNKISRSLNDTTQADIDQEVIQAIRNNRFGKNALQLANFDSQVKAGARVQDAIDLSYTAGRGSKRRTLEDLGIGKAELNIQSIEPASLTFQEYGKDYTVHLNKFNYEDEEGEMVKSIYGPMTIELENGEEVIQDPEMFRRWSNQQDEKSDIFIDPELRVVDSPEYIQKQFNSGAWIRDPVPVRTAPFTGKGPFQRSGTTYTYNIVNRRGDIINSIERTTYLEDLTASSKAQNIDPELVSIMIPKIELALEHTRIPGGSETLGEKEVFLLHLYMNRSRLDDAEDQNVDLAGKITRGMDVFAREAAVRTQDIMEEYPDLDYNKASQLAAKGAVVPLAFSYDDDEEAVLHQEKFFDFGRSPAINMLLAESMLSTGSRGAEGTDTNWEGVSPATMEKMAFEAFNELKNLRAVEGETNYYKREAAGALRQVEGFEDIVIRASVLDRKPEADSDGVNPFDVITNAGFFPTNWEEYLGVRGTNNEASVDPGVFTFEDLIKFEMGEASAADAEDDVAIRDTASSRFVDPSTLSLEDMAANLALQTAPSPTMQALADKLHAFLLHRGTRAGSWGRPEVSTVSDQDWQDVISKLSPEQQEVYKDLLEAGNLQAGRGSSSRVGRAEGGPSDKKKIIELAVKDMFEDDTLASRFIKHNEGFLPTPKWDNRQWTWGYGTKAPYGGKPDEAPPLPYLTITRKDAQKELMDYLDKEIVSKLNNYSERHNYNWNNNQKEALTSVLYTLGYGAINQLTDNGTRTNEEIAKKIPEYNKVRNEAGELVVSKGLTNRRTREKTYFEGNIN